MLPKTSVAKLTPDRTEAPRAALGLGFPALCCLQGQVTHVTSDRKAERPAEQKPSAM